MPNPLDGVYNLGALNELSTEELNTVGTPEAVIVNDVNNLSLAELAAKYGGIDNASNLIQAVSEGTSRFTNDYTQETSPLRTVGDVASNIGIGAFSSIGSLATAGIGLANAEAGTKASEALTGATNWLSENLLSDELQAQQRAVASRQAASEAFNKEKYSDSTLQRVLADLGDQFINGTFDTNLAIASNAVGTTATSIPLARGIRAAGNLFTTAAKSKADDVTTALVSEGFAKESSIPFTVANSLMEGAGSYQGGVQTVMEMTTDQLMSSPKFKTRYEENVASGMSRSEALQKAKIDTAQAVGIKAGTAGAIVGAASGPMSSWLERPFQAKLVTQAIGNALGETAGEIAEGSVESVGTNLAVKQEANPEQDIAEGLGSSIAESIIGSAGVSGPALGVGVIRGERAKALEETSKKKQKKNLTQAMEEAISATSPQVAQPAETTSETSKEVSLDEVQKTLSETPITLQETQKTSENLNEVSPEELNQSLVNVFNEFKQVNGKEADLNSEESWNKYWNYIKDSDAKINAVTEVLNNTHITPENVVNFITDTSNQIDAALALLNVYSLVKEGRADSLGEVGKKFNEARSQILSSSDRAGINPATFRKDVAEFAQKFQEVLSSSDQKVKDAAKNAEQYARENIGIVLAMTAPEVLEPETVQAVASSPRAMASLDASSRKIIELADKVRIEAEELYKSQKWPKGTTFNDVYKNIVFQRANESDGGKTSSYQYLMNIAQALKEGNKEKAENILHRFDIFRQHMTNKVNALNKSKKSKQRENFEAYSPDYHKWYTSEAFYSNTEKGNFFATQLNYETNVVNSIYKEAENLINPQEQTKTKEQSSAKVETSSNQNYEDIPPWQEISSEVKTEKEEEKEKENKKEPVKETSKKSLEDIPPWENIPNEEPKKVSSKPEPVKKEEPKQTELEKGNFSISKNGFEVSSKGNTLGKKFSAFNAKLKDGRSIEEHYQVDIKGYSSIKEGKGKPSKKTPNNKLWDSYLNLWRKWADTNPELMQQLREAVSKTGNSLKDSFAKTQNNQAKALATLLNEGYGLKKEPSKKIKELKVEEKKEEKPKKKSTALKRGRAFINSSGYMTKLHPSYEHEVTYDGLIYQSVEAAFLAQKYNERNLREQFTGLSSREARKLDQRLSKQKKKADDPYSKHADQSFWDRSEAVMADIYYHLFNQHPELWNELRKYSITNFKLIDSPLLEKTEVLVNASDALQQLRGKKIDISKLPSNQKTKNAIKQIESIAVKVKEKEENDKEVERIKEEKAEQVEKGLPPVVQALKELLSNVFRNQFRIVDVFTNLTGDNAIADLADTYENGTPKEQNYAATAIDMAEDLQEELSEEIKKAIDFNKLIAEERAAKKKTDKKSIVNGSLLLLDKTEEVSIAITTRFALAATQWFHSIGTKTGRRTESEEEVAVKLGIPFEKVTPELMKAYYSGVKLDFAIDQITQKAMEYLGLRADDNANYAGSIGLLNDISKNLLALLIKQGKLKKQNIRIPIDKNIFREYSFVVPVDLEKTVDGIAIANFLDENFNWNSSEKMYYDDEVPPIDTRVSHRSDDLTDKQKELLKIDNSQPYYLNEEMHNFFINTIGEENLIDLCGSPIPENSDWNSSLYDSMESRNRVLSDSIKMINLNKENMEEIARKKNIPLSQVKKFYAHSITSVGRLQEKEPYGPVASKLTREIISPIRKTVDLLDSNIKKEFRRAVAQAFDIKINKLLPWKVEESLSKIEEAFEKNGLFDHLKEVIYEKKPLDIALLKKSFEEANIHTSPNAFTTPLALHALYDWAKAKAIVEQAGFKGFKKASFETTLYTELDGITNGNFFLQVLNATAITVPWLKALARAGFFIGQKMTASQGYANEDWTGGLDNYYTFGSKKGWQSVKRAFKNLHAKGKRGFILPDFYQILSDDSYTAQVELARSIVKKPITAIGYYSGASGVTNKFMLDISNRANNFANKVLQGNVSAEDKQKIIRFQNSLNRLLSIALRTSKQDGQFYYLLGNSFKTIDFFKMSKEELRNFNLKNIKGTYIRTVGDASYPTQGSAYQALADNLNNSISKVFRAGVIDAIGSNVMNNINAQVQATQLVSTLYSRAYAQLTKEYLENRKEQFNIAENKGLSRSEERAILRQMEKGIPVVGSENYQYTLAAIAEDSSFKRASRSSMISIDDEGTKLPVTEHTPLMPIPMGVQYMASSNIQHGDATVVQVSARKDEQNLRVFDGINYGIGDAQLASIRVNNAVVDSGLNQNPTRELLNTVKSVYKFYKNFKFDEIYTDTEELMQALKTVIEKLEDNADNVDKIHNALKKVGVTSDQMASAETPYSSKEFGDEVRSVEDVYNELNNIVDPPVTPISLPPATGTYSLDSFLEKVVIAPGSDLGRALRILKDNLPKNLTIKVGNYADFSEELVSILSEQNIKGEAKSLFVGNTNTIYLFSDRIGSSKESNKAVVHELIHAGTAARIYKAFEKLENGEELTDSDRLIIFVEEDIDKFLENAPDDIIFNHFKEVLSQFKNDPVGRASRVSEFIAYVLTDPVIRKWAKKEKPNDIKNFKPLYFLNRLINNFIQFVFGRRSRNPLTKLKDDSVYNIAYATTAIAAAESATMSEEQLSLFMAEPMNSDLTDEELRFVSAFNDMVVNFEEKLRKYTEPTLASQKILEISQNAQDALVKAIEAGFTFNASQKKVFVWIHQALQLNGVLPTSNLVSIAKAIYLANKKLKTENFGSEEKEKFFKGITGTKKNVLATQIALIILDKDIKRALEGISFKSLDIESSSGLFKNLGNYLFSALERRVDGVNPKDSVYSAVMSHLKAIEETIHQQAGFISKAGDAGHNAVMRVNDWIVSKMEAIGSKAVDKHEETKNKAALVIAGLFSKEAILAQDYFASFLNRLNTYEPVKSFFREFIGATNRTYPIFALEKQAKSFIQRIRDIRSRVFPRVIKDEFKKELTEEDERVLRRVLADTDIGSLLSTGTSINDVLEILSDRKKLDSAIKAEERKLQSNKNFEKYSQKIDELVDYMTEGKLAYGLLRNAKAIADLSTGTKIESTQETINTIDRLITLRALKKNLEKEDFSKFKEEKDGLKAVINVLRQIRDVYGSKIRDNSTYNAIKGYIPREYSSYSRLIVSLDSNRKDLEAKGYTRVGDYNHSGGDMYGKMGYYLSSYNSAAAFSQGAFQDIAQTTSGVDVETGVPLDENAGLLQTDYYLEKYGNFRKNSNKIPMIPIFNERGIIKAYMRPLERSVMEKHLKPKNNFIEMLGIAEGRLVEEQLALGFNRLVVRRLSEMYERDSWDKRTEGKENEYVNLFDENMSPVVKDAVRILPNYVKAMIFEEFGTTKNGKPFFPVRKDLIRDVIGQRNASVTDLWTGTTNLNPKVVKAVRTMAETILGKKAMTRLKFVEDGIWSATSLLRNNIVVKSLTVPAFNIFGNILSLISRGIPIWTISKGISRKLVETERYMRLQLESNKLRAKYELLDRDDPKREVIAARISYLTEMIHKLSIYPLIKAGEFSTINDLGLTNDDLDLARGRFSEYFEKVIDKTPKALIQAGRWLFLAKGTTGYQAMEKATSYGDFIAKSILFDHYVGELKMNPEEALRYISEEFVNYDRLPGRIRGTLENYGLLWFYTYKLRIVKTALSQLRRNPLQSILALGTLNSLPDGVGLPLTDNIFSKIWTLEGIPGFGLDNWWRGITMPFPIQMISETIN